jgi:hypothetical protein
VEELKTQIRLHLPSAFPHQAVLRTLLGNLPRFVSNFAGSVQRKSTP